MLNAAPLSAETLAQAFEQSTDCVKLIGLSGQVLWVNPDGLCAMEIESAEAVCGLDWDKLWPDDSRKMVLDSLPAARRGETVRFDAFCPTAKGSPRWWNVTVSAVKNVERELIGYLAISRDITVTVIQRQALEIAAEEMRHRLKNTYAMIGSLFNGFAKGNAENEKFAQDMQQRLRSICAAQSLFVNDNAPGDVAVLIPALIEPFSTPECSISTDKVASIGVSQGHANAIALVIGELAVNSTKHGALAMGGAITVSTQSDETAFTLVWEEVSRARVAARTRAGGQGLSLIERIVRAREGAITVAWHSHGLVVSVRFERRGIPA